MESYKGLYKKTWTFPKSHEKFKHRKSWKCVAGCCNGIHNEMKGSLGSNLMCSQRRAEGRGNKYSLLISHTWTAKERELAILIA
jgi:hypothetical protein